jgi:hypothetical protein
MQALFWNVPPNRKAILTVKDIVDHGARARRIVAPCDVVGEILAASATIFLFVSSVLALSLHCE